MSAPTEEMIDAGCRAWMKAGGHHCDSEDLVGPIYLAMEAARPTTDVSTDGLVDLSPANLDALQSYLADENEHEAYHAMRALRVTIEALQRSNAEKNEVLATIEREANEAFHNCADVRGKFRRIASLAALSHSSEARVCVRCGTPEGEPHEFRHRPQYSSEQSND